MKGELRSGNVVVKGKKVFIGVDVHKVSWHVTARTGGEEVFNGGIPGQYRALRGVLDRFKGRNQMELICGLNVRLLFRMIGTGMIPGVFRDQFGGKPDSVLCLGATSQSFPPIVGYRRDTDF